MQIPEWKGIQYYTLLGAILPTTVYVHIHVHVHVHVHVYVHVHVGGHVHAEAGSYLHVYFLRPLFIFSVCSFLSFLHFSFF